jgi:hypothetical protein
VHNQFPRRIAALAFVLLPASLLTWHSGGLQADKPKLPSLAPVFGPDADKYWSAPNGSYAVANNKALGKPVLTAGKTPLVLKGPGLGDHDIADFSREFRALVRLRTDVAPSAAADFYFGWNDAKKPGLRMLITTTRSADHVSCQVQQNGKPLHDAAALAQKLDWTPTPSNGLTYYPRAYALRDIRPFWPEDFRVPIEHDMAALPDVPDKWLSVCVQVRRGEVLFWLDDRLVAHKSGADARVHGGDLRIGLSPGVQLATFEEVDWNPQIDVLPIRLEGYANARTFLGGASLKRDKPQYTGKSWWSIGGIPFLFCGVNSEGNDHIDVGRSLYRQANLDGYMPSSGHRWAGSARRDPARIQLRIPNGPYHSMHLLAAADGRPDHVPLITAMFYRPGAGFAESFTARVPLATAKTIRAFPVRVTLNDGKEVNLWRITIPLDPGRLSAFADMDLIEVELTKEVHQFRSYPDPFIYGWHQGGRPSAVHVYALTLAKTQMGFDFAPDRFGHVWTAPQVPGYTATVANQGNRFSGAVKGKLIVSTRSYDGSETTRQEKQVQAAVGTPQKLKFAVPVKLNGYHDITATLQIGDWKWTEKCSFVRLAPDKRAPRWTEGKGALFGYWSYHGGHYTPKADHHIDLMTWAGARTSIGLVRPDNPLVKKHWARVPAGAWEVARQDWAAEDPIDPKKYAAYQKTVVDAFTRARSAILREFRPDHVYFFPEPHVSQRLTEGNIPTYWGAPDYALTAEEKKNLRAYFMTAKCAAEAIRRTFPDLKILIPWGDALFIPPLLRDGFPKNLIDGSGIDTPGFERLPEMQLHQISVHRLYELRKEYARAGIPSPRLQYCEGIFVPTEPGAVTWREQMDLYNRWVLISMAYGISRFYSGWFAFDCGNYYGSEHYGGCGIQRRIPYCDPKPAYAAYATMTDRLDQANFAGRLKTGSLTTYCLRFQGPRGPVYTLWTLRGKRPLTLTLAADAAVSVTDAMNNTRVLQSKNKEVTLTTDPSVIYVSGARIVAAAVGPPDHADARPAKDSQVVADLGDGSWRLSGKRDPTYEHGTFAVQRFPGKFTIKVVDDTPPYSAPAEKGEAKESKVLQVTLEKQDKVYELMPWYTLLVPQKPIVLKGAPAALGLWVKGASDWGRVIYTLRDAKGERWTSIGTQDQYNCDDVHSWSAFNFDGWRYLRFELPGHAGWDSFRKHGTTWWRSDGGDGIVDLPLRLENIIIEQRSHVLYVNDVQPAASNVVRLGKLVVEYASPDDATEEAVRISRLRMALPIGLPVLPNPIAEMQRDGQGTAPTITRLEPPAEHNDGTKARIFFQEAPSAKAHFVWVSAHADGRGAVNLTPAGARSGVLLTGLRPGLKSYFWVTYRDAMGKMSKPSRPGSITLIDTFNEK